MPYAFTVPETKELKQVKVLEGIDDFVIIEGDNINPNNDIKNRRKVLLIHIWKLEKVCCGEIINN